MLTRETKHIEVVAANSAEQFQHDLNKLFLSLAERGVKYELQTDVSKGFIAYVIYTVSAQVPETIGEQFEMGGEKHTCLECPYFVRPVDGRRKYTRCPLNNYITSGDKSCCDGFYEKLFKGEINLIDPYYEVKRNVHAEEEL